MVYGDWYLNPSAAGRMIDAKKEQKRREQKYEKNKACRQDEPCAFRYTGPLVCAGHGDAKTGAALADMETPSSMVAPGGRIYEQRTAVVRELEKIDGLSFVKNNSAFYIFPRLDVKKFGITNDKKFAGDLLEATGILVIPGSGFDWQQPDHFRIVMLPEAKVLTDAVRRMGNFLDGYRQNM